MVEDYDFVIYLDVDWESPGQKNRQHFLVATMARALEGRSKVLAVERPICPVTSPWRRPERFWAWLLGQRKLRQVQPNLWVCTPAVLVHDLIAERIPGLPFANRRLLARSLQKVLKRLDFRGDHTISWVHHPYQIPYLGLVAESMSIYDCYDRYGAQDSFQYGEDVCHREERLLGQVSLVFAASRALVAELAPNHTRVHYLPNGVQYEHFAQAAGSGASEAVEFAGIRHPILGFVGKLSSRLDFGLLKWLMEAHPEWSLVLVGPEDNAGPPPKEAWRALRALLNVHYLGPKPYGELPAYMAAFDICLIPYQEDEFNRYSNPLKICEYLATGKPIISMAIPEAERLGDLLGVAKDYQEFEQAVEEALAEEDGQKTKARQELAAANSWAARAEEVLAYIEEDVLEAISPRRMVG